MTHVQGGHERSPGFIVIGAVAGYFLLTEHRHHFFGALPLPLLLACPVMHLFMHHGHGGHGGGHADHYGGEQASNMPASPQDRKTGKQL